jgi:hypothetical protein
VFKYAKKILHSLGKLARPLTTLHNWSKQFKVFPVALRRLLSFNHPFISLNLHL